MKTITSLCMALMAVLLPAVADAQREPDKQADAALAKLATEMRAAALKFTWKMSHCQGRRTPRPASSLCTR